jgi:hypothetical protein
VIRPTNVSKIIRGLWISILIHQRDGLAHFTGQAHKDGLKARVTSKAIIDDTPVGRTG